jgi:imidazolonepropionase-like amidohydrolase
MVNAGMAPIDSLIAGTSNAADLVALDNEGAIAEGSAADMLIDDGDPSTDITMASRPENHRMVLKQGRVVLTAMRSSCVIANMPRHACCTRLSDI